MAPPLWTFATRSIAPHPVAFLGGQGETGHQGHAMGLLQLRPDIRKNSVSLWLVKHWRLPREVVECLDVFKHKINRHLTGLI